jgi:hypothetical protein
MNELKTKRRKGDSYNNNNNNNTIIITIIYTAKTTIKMHSVWLGSKFGFRGALDKFL